MDAPLSLVSHTQARWREISSPKIDVLLLTLAAAALRAFRIGRWSLTGDELWTLRDSLKFDWQSTKFLLFLINHYVVAPFTALDETSLRLVPYIAGVLAVPIVYWLLYELYSRRVAALAGLFIVFSPWHLYASQFGRYYTLVFLFSACAGLFLLRGMRDRHAGYLVLALVSLALATASHPSAAFLGAALVLWAALWMLRAEGRALFSAKPLLIFYAPLTLGGLVAAFAYLGPVFLAWKSKGIPWGHSFMGLPLSMAGWIGPAIALFAVVGLAWSFVQGARLETSLVALCAFVPPIILAALTPLVSVSTSYTFAALPYWLIGTALGIDALFANLVGARALAYAVLLSLLASQGPGIVSQYIDGNSLDYRSAATYLQKHVRGDDPIVADEPKNLEYYLPDRAILESDSARLVSLREDGRRYWVVAELLARGGFGSHNPVTPDWQRSGCSLEATFYRPRLDYRINRLDVFACEPPRW